MFLAGFFSLRVSFLLFYLFITTYIDLCQIDQAIQVQLPSRAPVISHHHHHHLLLTSPAAAIRTART